MQVSGTTTTTTPTTTTTTPTTTTTTPTTTTSAYNTGTTVEQPEGFLDNLTAMLQKLVSDVIRMLLDIVREALTSLLDSADAWLESVGLRSGKSALAGDTATVRAVLQVRDGLAGLSQQLDRSDLADSLERSLCQSEAGVPEAGLFGGLTSILKRIENIRRCTLRSGRSISLILHVSVSVKNHSYIMFDLRYLRTLALVLEILPVPRICNSRRHYLADFFSCFNLCVG